MNGYYPPYQQQPQQIQNGGVVRVRNEAEARDYPVAPGNSVIFVDNSAPYCYVKTMSYSQFDPPRFERFRRVKEETPAPQMAPAPDYVTRADFEALKAEIEKLKNPVKEETTNEQPV